jgi:hypothetical protein
MVLGVPFWKLQLNQHSYFDINKNYTCNAWTCLGPVIACHFYHRSVIVLGYSLYNGNIELDPSLGLPSDANNSLATFALRNHHEAPL